MNVSVHNVALGEIRVGIVDQKAAWLSIPDEHGNQVFIYADPKQSKTAEGLAAQLRDLADAIKFAVAWELESALTDREENAK